MQMLITEKHTIVRMILLQILTRTLHRNYYVPAVVLLLNIVASHTCTAVINCTVRELFEA